MKKTLKLFTSISLLTTPIINVISCNDNSHNDKKENKIIKKTNLGLLKDNKISTIKEKIIQINNITKQEDINYVNEFYLMYFEERNETRTTLWNKNAEEEIIVNYSIEIKDLNDLIKNKNLGEIDISENEDITNKILEKNPDLEDYLLESDIMYLHITSEFAHINSDNPNKFLKKEVVVSFKNINKTNLDNIITNYKFKEIASDNMEDEILNYVIWKNKDADLSKDKLSIEIIDKTHAKIIPKKGTNLYIGSHDIEYIDYNEKMNNFKKDNPAAWIYKDLTNNEIKIYNMKNEDDSQEILADASEIFQIGYNSEFEPGILPLHIEKVPNWISPKIKSLSQLFYKNCGSHEELSNWDVSHITDLSLLFKNATGIKANISNWDVSNVINMNGTFSDSTLFNQDISKWDTSNVTDMAIMFDGARDFNQDISNWNTSNVIDMRQMFRRTSSFNQDISKWDVSKVVDHEDFDEHSNENWTDDKKPKWN